MSNENLDSIIERYKRELLAFDRSSRAVSAAIPASAPANQQAAEAEPQAAAVQAVPTQLTEAELPFPAPTPEIGTPFPAPTPTPAPTPPADAGIPFVPEAGTAQGNLEEARGTDGLDNFRYDVPADSGSNEFSPYYNDNEAEYESFDEFLNANPKNGFLRVRSFAADEAMPIPNARVVVTCRINNSPHVFYDQLTDSNGVVFGLLLPAPDKGLSSYPTALRPYALYDVEVSHPDFVSVFFKGILIFDGIETIQLAQLVPLAQAGPIQEEIVISEDRPEEE